MKFNPLRFKLLHEVLIMLSFHIFHLYQILLTFLGDLKGLQLRYKQGKSLDALSELMLLRFDLCIYQYNEIKTLRRGLKPIKTILTRSLHTKR